MNKKRLFLKKYVVIFCVGCRTWKKVVKARSAEDAAVDVYDNRCGRFIRVIEKNTDSRSGQYKRAKSGTGESFSYILY